MRRERKVFKQASLGLLSFYPAPFLTELAAQRSGLIFKEAEMTIEETWKRFREGMSEIETFILGKIYPNQKQNE